MIRFVPGLRFNARFAAPFRQLDDLEAHLGRHPERARPDDDVRLAHPDAGIAVPVWTVCLCQLPSFQLRQQDAQGAFDDRRRIAVRHRVSQKILDPPQLVAHFPADGDLQPVALRRERRDHSRPPGYDRRSPWPVLTLGSG